MCKQPEEMTAAELGMLFPILLAKHDPAWQGRYQEEADRLATALGSRIVRIHHIGSTSVHPDRYSAKSGLPVFTTAGEPRAPYDVHEGIYAAWI